MFGGVQVQKVLAYKHERLFEPLILILYYNKNKKRVKQEIWDMRFAKEKEIQLHT